MDQTTCWTLIRDAADGHSAARDEFARLYQPVVRTFLMQRWRTAAGALDLDDAVQDVFVDCLRDDGALRRVDVKSGDFRPFLYGVVRNVARRHEERLAQRERRHVAMGDQDFKADESGAATVFDRAWARAMMKEAARVMRELAAVDDQRSSKSDGRATRRVELLQLRFQNETPIREIARLWNVEADWLHHEYATARQEFHRALLQVIAFQHPEGTREQHIEICHSLLGALK
jgi:RNA polymerase sigma factor (sigma-70 family)